MTRAQRIVTVLYCLLVVYCCVWVPWLSIMPMENAQSVKEQEGYDWVWSVGCEAPTTNRSATAPVENAKPANDTSPPQYEVVDAPPPSPCHGFKVGEPDMMAISLRLLAVTALGVAAFLLAGKWKGTP
ncbi:MAG TPA: hypothetical protein VKI40_00595 [Terriglobales bacterium]|nr:hypothetical protein [Terriglobales bacterium]